MLVVLDIRPVERNLVIDGMQKVASAYIKDSNPVEFLKGSNVLYVDNIKTTSLLRTIGFQSPIKLNDSGFVGRVSYYKQNVKFEGKPFSDKSVSHSKKQINKINIWSIFDKLVFMVPDTNFILKKYKPEFVIKRADGTIDDTDYHLASSMLSYIDNECSFIDGFNLVQESVDPEQYRKVMKKIFEKLDQSQHYRMMTHGKD